MECIKCGEPVDSQRIVWSKRPVCEECIKKALKEFEETGFVKEYECVWVETIDSQGLE